MGAATVPAAVATTATKQVPTVKPTLHPRSRHATTSCAVRTLLTTTGPGLLRTGAKGVETALAQRAPAIGWHQHALADCVMHFMPAMEYFIAGTKNRLSTEVRWPQCEAA